MKEPAHVTKAREMQAAMSGKAVKAKSMSGTAVKPVAVPNGDTTVAVDLSPINAKIKIQDQTIDRMCAELTQVAENQFAQAATAVEMQDAIDQLGYQDQQLLEHINHAKKMVGQFNATNVQSQNRMGQKIDANDAKVSAELQKISEGMKALSDRTKATQNNSWNLAVGSVIVSVVIMIIMSMVISATSQTQGKSPATKQPAIQKVQ